MIEYLDREKLWPTVASLLKRPRHCGRNLVAVAYLGEGAARLLPLRQGDVLVCALTLANCRSGTVCPKEIRILKRRGVCVYALRDLHAKVLLLDDRVIVGSANASESSKSDLDEAAISTSNRLILARVHAWFKSRMHSPVGYEWLRRCEAAYRKPRFGNRHSTNGGESRMWLMGATDAEFPEEERHLYRAVDRAAARRARRKNGFEPLLARYPRGGRMHRLLMKGDSVVVEWDGVRQPASVLYAKRGRSRTGGKVLYYSLELPMAARPLAWEAFRTACRRGGLRLGKAAGSREIKRPEDIRLIEGILARRARPARSGKRR